MFNDILLFHRGVEIAPLRRPHRPLLAILPLPIRPPAGQNPTPRLRQVQEPLKVDQRVVSVVESASVAGEVVVVLNAHAVAVHELAESHFLGELVEVVVWTDTLEEVAGHFWHGVEVGCGLGFLLRIALLRRRAECLVGLPIRFLAVAAAVPLVMTFGAAFEGCFCLSLVAFGAGVLSGLHSRRSVN